MSGAGDKRVRTYEWQDPKYIADGGFDLSGLDFLRRLIAENLVPPIAATMNFTLSEVAEGRAVFTGVPGEYHYNPIGTVHGGYFATLLDSAMGCAVHTTLPAGLAYTTLEFKINLVRPLTIATGEVACEASVVHRGRRMATAEGRIVDGDGKIYAHGSTTCMIFEAPKRGAPKGRAGERPDANGND